MKLIINKITNTVEFGFDNDSTIFTQGLNWIEVNGKKWININSSNYEEVLVVGINLPSNFFNGGFHYIKETGEFFQTTETQLAWQNLRKERNKRLAECDWTQVADVTLSNKVNWDTYRQSLRNLPSTIVNPFSVVFPLAPNEQDPNKLPYEL